MLLLGWYVYRVSALVRVPVCLCAPPQLRRSAESAAASHRPVLLSVRNQPAAGFEVATGAV